ncbi:hypothetical protein COK90_08870 [Priestia megaterium]|uniref:hypothetical protein n=1 Tax=Priestia megaterium TaxID=1404 RepID=UPI000BFA9C57|nr:hypothetical protein [Priestia megaterium]PFU64057.1 hypothetical protein COK90_08870 [Priestia megaterium]
MALSLEMLVKYIKDCNDELNKKPPAPPTASEFKDYLKKINIRGNPYSNYKHNQILGAANLVPKKTWRLSEDEIEQRLTTCKNMLLELYNINKETPVQDNFIEYLHSNGNTFAWSRYKTYNELLNDLEIPLNMRRYSKEELKKLLLDKIQDNKGKVPSQLDLEQDKEMPNVAAYIRAFKKPYNEILEDWNLTPNYFKDRYSPDDLIEYLKEFYSKKNRPPYYEELENPSWSIFKRHFGGLLEAIKVAKIPYNASQFGSTYESNHGDIRPSFVDGKVDDWIYNNGIIHEHEVPYQELINTEEQFVVDYVISESPYLIEVAGMVSESEFLNGCTQKIKQDYIKKLKKKIDIVNNSQYELIVIFSGDPKQEEKLSVLLPLSVGKPSKQQDGKIITETKKEKRTAKKYQDEYLINNIVTRYYELGEKVPTINDMFVDGWPNPQGTYLKRGNWSSWIKKSGVKDLYKKKLKLEMLNHLLNIEKMVNRRPYCTDLEKYLRNGFNRDKYRTEFGSWTNALSEYDVFKKNTIDYQKKHEDKL